MRAQVIEPVANIKYELFVESAKGSDEGIASKAKQNLAQGADAEITEIFWGFGESRYFRQN